MGLVPFLKIFCAAYILLGVSFFCCGLVHHIVLDTVSIEGAFVLSTLLTVAFFLLCGWLVVRQDLLIVCLYDCLQVFGATVGYFHCIPVANASQRVLLWKVFVH